MVFLDGVGIGKKDFEHNPFFKYGFKAFEQIFGAIPDTKNYILKRENRILFPIDACLGVEGLPQSGTGQASLFCGFNAPKLAGKHFGPYPYSTTIPKLKEENILLHYNNENEKSFFANAYPRVFFDYIDSGRSRLSVTTLTCKLAGISFNGLEEVKEGRALTAELTNERWNKKLGYNLPVIKPEEAARRLIKISEDYKFTLFEYYLSDHLGHLRLANEFEKLFKELDDFLFTLLQEFDGKNSTLIICSDHGNLEDTSTKTHTFNPALTITMGRKATDLHKSVNNLTDIKQAIINHCN